MSALRLSVFLPRPTSFYRGLLPQMLRGFEQAGFEVSGTTELLGEAELLAWCREQRTDVVFEMNRTRSEVPFLPPHIKHVSWIVDFLGRSEAQIKGSDITYFFTTGWVAAFVYDTFADWLPPGTCPSTYAPRGLPFASDVSVAGHVPAPWTELELKRNLSRTQRPLSFGDFLPPFLDYLAMAEHRMNTLLDHEAFNHGTLWTEVNRQVEAATGDGIVDDPVIKYDILGRLPRTGLRPAMVREALSAGYSTRIYGTKGWSAWPEFAPHYRGFLEQPADLADAYESSRMNLHEGEGMHFRSLDCLASGGLLFYCTSRKSSDQRGGWNYRPGGAKLNLPSGLPTPGQHFVEYYPGELAEKARYYLAHSAQADALRQRARATVCEHHTWRHRALKVARDLASL
jgi:hypothetical protein